MLVKFLNSDSTVSTAIAGSYFKGDGWTGAYYDSGTGQLVFESEDGLGFTTGDLRVSTGGTSTVEWADILNKPTSFAPSTHTHNAGQITGLATVNGTVLTAGGNISIPAGTPGVSVTVHEFTDATAAQNFAATATPQQITVLK